MHMYTFVRTYVRGSTKEKIRKKDPEIRPCKRSRLSWAAWRGGEGEGGRERSSLVIKQRWTLNFLLRCEWASELGFFFHWKLGFHFSMPNFMRVSCRMQMHLPIFSDAGRTETDSFKPTKASWIYLFMTGNKGISYACFYAGMNI